MAHPIRNRSFRRYLGNINSKEVHDLYNEKPQCQIVKIIQAGHAVMFIPDTLAQG